MTPRDALTGHAPVGAGWPGPAAELRRQLLIVAAPPVGDPEDAARAVAMARAADGGLARAGLDAVARAEVQVAVALVRALADAGDRAAAGRWARRAAARLETLVPDQRPPGASAWRRLLSRLRGA